MLLNSVLAIPRTHSIFLWFKRKQMFIPKEEVALAPEEIAGSAAILPKTGLLVSPAFLQLWPCAIVSSGPSIYTYWDQTEKPCHLWIGGNIEPRDLIYGNYAVIKALERNLATYAKIKNQRNFFVGYLYSLRDTNQNAFGMLYFLKTNNIKPLKSKYIDVRPMTIAEIKKVYRKLDPWSKRLFDYIYEHPSVRKKMNLYQRKISIKTD